MSRDLASRIKKNRALHDWMNRLSNHGRDQVIGALSEYDLNALVDAVEEEKTDAHNNGKHEGRTHYEQLIGVSPYMAPELVKDALVVLRSDAAAWRKVLADCGTDVTVAIVLDALRTVNPERFAPAWCSGCGSTFRQSDAVGSACPACGWDGVELGVRPEAIPPLPANATAAARSTRASNHFDSDGNADLPF